MVSSAGSPLLILCCIDALRYDCVGYQQEHPFFDHLQLPRRLCTPTLDAIAEQSVRFHKAISHAGYTPLSHATMFTGTYAYQHGMVDFTCTRCRPEIVTLTDVLSRHGWQIVVGPGPQPILTSQGQLIRRVDRIVGRDTCLIDLLDESRSQPTFVYLRYEDVHDPYLLSDWDESPGYLADFQLMTELVFGLKADLERRQFVDVHGNRVGFDKWREILARPIPEEQRAVRLRTLFQIYTRGVEKFDQFRFRRLIERLQERGIWDRATVVIFGDHGEAPLPKAPWSLNHGHHVAEQLTRIPLLIKSPDLEPRDVRSLVGLVDFLPTILDLLGYDHDIDSLEYHLDGVNLIETIRTDRPAQQAYLLEGWANLVSPTHRPRPVLHQRAIRTADDRKYLFWGDVIDPNEWRSLDEDAFARYAIERVLGEIPNEAGCAQIRRLLQQGPSRDQVVGSLAAGVRRHWYFDLSADPLELRGERLHPRHPRWSEYEPHMKRMIEWTGRPCWIDADQALSPEQQQQLLEHLAALGYVE